MRFNKISAVMNNNLRRKKVTSNTLKQYRAACTAFASFIKEREGTERIPMEKYKEQAQCYFEFLKEKGKSPDTIHTYAAGIAQGLKMSIDDFVIERRTRPVKGRNKPLEPKGDICDIGFAIGIRKEEYKRLKGKHLIERDGHMFVVVEKGKGGKYQEQLILPENREAVKKYFQDVDDDEYIVSKQEFGLFDEGQTHAMRRKIARQAYDYYNGLSKEERYQYLELARQIFMQNKLKGQRMWRKEIELIKRSPIRYCRGDNKTELIRQGRKPFFDRECVLLVSVLHLAHYREDVTVDNYLI